MADYLHSTFNFAGIEVNGFLDQYQTEYVTVNSFVEATSGNRQNFSDWIKKQKNVKGISVKVGVRQKSTTAYTVDLLGDYLDYRVDELKDRRAQAILSASFRADLKRTVKETNGQQVTASQHEINRAAIREDLIAALLEKHQAGTWLKTETMEQAGLNKVEMSIAGWEAYIKGKQLTISRCTDEESREMFQRSIDMAQESIQKIKQRVTA